MLTNFSLIFNKLYTLQVSKKDRESLEEMSTYCTLPNDRSGSSCRRRVFFDKFGGSAGSKGGIGFKRCGTMCDLCIGGRPQLCLVTEADSGASGTGGNKPQSLSSSSLALSSKDKAPPKSAFYTARSLLQPASAASSTMSQSYMNMRQGSSVLAARSFSSASGQNVGSVDSGMEGGAKRHQGECGRTSSDAALVIDLDSQ